MISYIIKFLSGGMMLPREGGHLRGFVLGERVSSYARDKHILRLCQRAKHINFYVPYLHSEKIHMRLEGYMYPSTQPGWGAGSKLRQPTNSLRKGFR